MNVFAKFDEILSMILQDIEIKETKRYGHKNVSDNVKTVYPPTNTVCGGIKTSFAKFDIVLKWVKVNSGSSFI